MSSTVRARARQGLSAALAACSLVAGCAPMLRYDPSAPPTVTLPLAHAGIDDRQTDFAALFAALLADDPVWRDVAPPGRWLHGADDAGGAAAGPVQPMRERYAARAASTSVLIVPGLFGDCLGPLSQPFGDGEPGYPALADLGLAQLRAAPLPGRATVDENAARLAALLRAEADRPGVSRIVVIGYSKGTADALQALDLLARGGGVPPALHALVSVAGVVGGTPLADRYEGWYEAWAPWLAPFECSASKGRELAELTRRERGAWLATHRLPHGVAYHSVIAHAARDEVARPLQSMQVQLASLDPRNDGQVLAGDAVLPGGSLLAQARADHWSLALPLERHPNVLLRGFMDPRPYPRQVLLRALIVWAVAVAP